LSPALCGETEDPPADSASKNVGDVDNNGENHNEKVSQYSQAVSVTLLCETGEERSSSFDIPVKQGENETPEPKELEGSTNFDKPAFGDEDTKVDSKPAQDHSADDPKEKSPVADGDADANVLQDDGEDSATQLSEVVPSSDDETSVSDEKKKVEDSKPMKTQSTERVAPELDGEKVKATEPASSKKTSKEDEVEGDEHSNGDSTSNKKQGATKADNALQPIDEAAKTERKTRGGKRSLDTKIRDPEEQPSALKRSRILGTSTVASSSKTPKRLASPADSNRTPASRRERTRSSPGAGSASEESVPSIRVVTTGVKVTSTLKNVSSTFWVVKYSLLV
jgi:hypothetical protein